MFKKCVSLASPSNGSEYYQYVLLCTDDILAIMEEPERFIWDELDQRFERQKVANTKVSKCRIKILNCGC
jgi:hypothetical protein